MINKIMFKQVQAFKRQGYSKSAIVKALEMDPRTVAKYFAMEEEAYRAYRREHLFRDKAFDDLRGEILEVYEANGFRELQVSSLYDYLDEKHGVLPGNEQTLRNYVAFLIKTDSLRLDQNVRLYTKVPQLPFGQQMQADFGRYRCRSGLVLYIFAALLSASRYKYVVFQGQPFRTLDVIRHLLDSFDYFGGRPAELVIDQDRLMVVSENAGDIIYTADFKDFIDEQEFRLYVCQRANGKISQATKQIPAVLIEQERAALRPLRNSIFRKDALHGREERTANEKALISVQACTYQLPPKYRNRTVEIYTTEEELFVFDLFTGKEIIAYRLSLIPGQLISTKTCHREGEKTIEELKTAVSGLFELESWKRFVERNFKTFPRYVRDQCLEGRRFFAEKEIDLGILEQALAYCLENDTLSFANLKDTYIHFERESRQVESVIRVEVEGLSHYQPLEVSQRHVSEYESAARERTVS